MRSKWQDCTRGTAFKSVLFQILANLEPISYEKLMIAPHNVQEKY